jgi:carbon-monoxide dehydrogenase large subunit
MNEIVTTKYGIGAPVRRREDASLITGHGRYTGDMTPEGTLHAVLVRSQVAHGRFTLSGLDEARAAPGVRLVWTAADVSDLGDLPCKVLFRLHDGSRVKATEHPLLARGTVRHVGEAIAFVVADSVAEARDAAELISVDYDPLDAVVETAAALAPDAPRVWADRPDNLAYELLSGDREKTDAAFARAARVVELTLVNNRLVANYMEPRAAIGAFDPETGRYTLTAGTQGGHSVRDIVAKDIMRIDPKRLRVVTPDVGGGFGTKSFVYGEYPLVLKAAEVLGRPVKWIQERSEHFQIDSHGRDNVTKAALALDADGRFIGLRIDLVAAMGAYLSQYGPDIPRGGISMSTGLYDIDALSVRVRAVFTHTVPVDAYRGAGRPEAAYVIERLVDRAARELGVDPVELRLRNFIRNDQLPYRTATGRLYDTGEFDGHLRRAVEVADVAGFPARRAAAKAEGRWRGIGIASYVEACAFPGSEEANVVLNRDGTATLFIGTQTNGQGHATAYGQLIAAYLGLDLDKIETVQGDTDRVAKGDGTGGSRSIPLGLASVDIASKVLVKQLKDLAADRLEASAEDIELVGGAARVVGTDKAVPLSDIAATAPVEMLRAHGNFQQDECTYPNGTHVCEVEVDPETGVTRVVRHTVVDDFGVTVNPVLLAGQVHGGVVQSIGQALLERTVFDDSGQLLTATFLDYCMPRADDVPFFHFETRNVPSTTNLLGIKGAGEAGTVGATPAVVNAVVDALDHGAGIRDLDMPLTPARVWAAIHGT